MSSDFQPKKLPRQARSRQTFDAIVEACARLLIADGYGALTTNHIAEVAGVSIGSLYEYFGDKDAVVYEVVRRTAHGFSEDAARPLPAFGRVSVRTAITSWIDALFAAMRSREPLLRAIAADVPQTIREPHERESRVRYLELARTAYRMAGDHVRQDRVEEVSFLLVTLVEAALTRLVLDPPDDVSPAVVVDELSCRVLEWVAPRSRARPRPSGSR
ncbi:TetR/AcrR family transcriptional regulator [Paraliomyxa miuraensis]|uniref:TetR/AcrR family transcriptional regulator n=1 Tax=Paraliomyxa miuraensis TaxID=376150 RepID=UPI00224EA077|nr:TetR/AcrR family transcriptional regulator [Paraliomyxa miuraensis]MCX4242975.1 TetR/AcrR family transcriptional regulator [Paraliomyxa miuraensis]